METWKLRVKAVPNASKDEICGWLGEELKIRVAAPPEGGRANARIVEVLAGVLGVPEGGIRVVTGGGSPRKILEVTGSSLEHLRKIISAR